MSTRSKARQQQSTADPQSSASAQTVNQAQPEASPNEFEGDPMEIDEGELSVPTGVTAMTTAEDSQDISEIKYSELSSLEDCLEYFPNMSDEDKNYLRIRASEGKSWLKGIRRTGEYVMVRSTFPKLHEDVRLYRLFFLMEKGHDIIGSTSDGLRNLFPEEDKRYYTDYKKYEIDPKEAFERESKDLDLSLGFFHQKLLELKNQRLVSEKSVAYVNMCQSSGTGKSRVATELYKEDIYVIYCSFIKTESTGHPKRSIMAGKLSEELNNNFYSYLAACLELAVACWCFGVSPKTFHKCITDKETEIRTAKWLQGRILSIKNPADVISECSKILNKYSGVLAAGKNEIYKIFNVTEPENIEIREDKLFAVFVFDEVNALTKLYNENIHYLILLKKALNLLPRELNVFSLLLDTSSMLNELKRNNEFTTSEKKPSDTVRSHMPIYIFGSEWNKPDMVNDRNIFSPSRLYKIGRPMWSVYLQGKSESMLPIMLEFAREKLMNKNLIRGFMDDPDIPEIRPLIVFGPLLDLNVLNVGLVEQLVSGNMGYVYFISKNLKLVHSAYLPEPILSSAAISIFQGEGNQKLLIEELSAAIHAGNISQGECGEITARLLILLAKIETKSFNPRSSKDSISPVYLEDYLKTLGGVDVKEALKDRSDLKEAIVFFNAFIKRDETPDLNSLLFHFAMCLAIICKDSQVGVDVIIPVWCPNKHGHYEWKAENMSFVAFSIKNHSDPFSPKDVFEHAVEKTTAKRTKIETTRDYMCILMTFSEVYIGGPSFDPRAVYKSVLEDKLQKLDEKIVTVNKDLEKIKEEIESLKRGTQTEETKEKLKEREKKQKEKEESPEKMKNMQKKRIAEIEEINKDKKQVCWTLAGLGDTSYSFINKYTPDIRDAIKKLTIAKIDCKKDHGEIEKQLLANSSLDGKNSATVGNLVNEFASSEFQFEITSSDESK